MGNPFSIKMMNACPVPRRSAFSSASCIRSGSFPVVRTQARPAGFGGNFIPNLMLPPACTIAS